MDQVALFSKKDLAGETGPAALAKLRAEAESCKACRLSLTRTRVVFGDGCEINPKIAFVGEGPGAEEDRMGVPFVGRSGVLLDRMISAMGMSREKDVYICNSVRCRPPDNRSPVPQELMECRPFLSRQLAAVAPQCIVALGASAAKTLLRSKKTKVTSLRGKWLEWNGIPLLVTYHPAALLRNPAWKPQAWEDLQAVLLKLSLMSAT